MIADNFQTRLVVYQNDGNLEEDEKGFMADQSQEGWLLVFAEVKPESNAENIFVEYKFRKMKPAERGAWLGRQFVKHRDAWRAYVKYVGLSSNPTAYINCDSYRAIIAMGPEVLPFIFKEMKSKVEFWFSALREITGENPVSPDRAGDIYAMNRDWLKWWHEHQKKNELSKVSE
jgi:hypothetical protein